MYGDTLWLMIESVEWTERLPFALVNREWRDATYASLTSIIANAYSYCEAMQIHVASRRTALRMALRLSASEEEEEDEASSTASWKYIEILPGTEMRCTARTKHHLRCSRRWTVAKLKMCAQHSGQLTKQWLALRCHTDAHRFADVAHLVEQSDRQLMVDARNIVHAQLPTVNPLRLAKPSSAL